MKKTRLREMAPASQGPAYYEWLIPIAVLTSIVGVVYLRLINAEFVNFDDPDYVYENPQVSGGLSWDGLIYAFTTNDMSNWHPVTWLSLMLDAQVYGGWAGGFHLTNVLLHLGGVIAYYLSLIYIFEKRAFAFLSSLLYAVHPLHVESVAWISERKGVLSTFFWILSLLAYSYYVKQPSARRMFLAAVPVALGLMSKQMLVTLPIALLLLDYWPLKRSIGLIALLKEKLFFFVICSLFTVIAYVAQKSGGALESLEYTPLVERCSNALLAFNAYLVNFAFPAGLYIPRITPRTPHPTWLVILCLILSMGMGVAGFLSRHRFPHVAIGVFWYFVTIVPVIGIVPIGIQWMADRYTNIPMMGVSWAIVWQLAPCLTKPSSTRKFSVGCVSVVVVCLVYLSACQASVWKNSETLFKNTLRHDPTNELAQLHLGSLYLKTNDFGKADSSLRAIVNDERVSPIVRSMAANNLIHMLTSQGMPSEAAKLLNEQRDFDYTSYEDTVIDLANSLAATGNLDGAHQILRVAVKASPDHMGLRLTFGTHLLRERRVEDAREQFLKATVLDPNFADGFYNLGLAEVSAGKHQNGIAAYLKAIEIEPNRPEFYNNLAVAYVATGEPDRAIENYRIAIRLNEKYAVAHYNLASILQSKNMLDDAIFHLDQSLRFAGPNKALATAAASKKTELLQTVE